VENTLAARVSRIQTSTIGKAGIERHRKLDVTMSKPGGTTPA